VIKPQATSPESAEKPPGAATPETVRVQLPEVEEGSGVGDEGQEAHEGDRGVQS